jgi:predicted phage tail protein
VDDFTQASVVANPHAKVYADPVGESQEFYYWVANVSLGGVEGPPNGVGGTLGRTAPDIDQLLDALEGQILASSLAASLSSRIDLVDGADTLPGSVNARLTSYAATVDGQIGAVQETVNIHADSLNGLEAEYTVKVDVNGHVAGIGLSTSDTASQIIMLADRFAIVNPGQTAIVPFVVESGSVYIRSAMIANGAIQSAQIGALAVDDARIANLSAAKVTFGEMSGERIGVNSLDANRIITDTLVAKLALITDAYIINANIENLTIGGEKFQMNAISNCGYMQVSSGGSGGSFTSGVWMDFNTSTSGGSTPEGGGVGGGGTGGGSGGGGGEPVFGG